jgi:pimeloyl-ACP methyl ester carboxylesterase
MRFASASYGSSFLKFMRIGKEMPILRALDDTHHELRSFAHHTQSDTDSILLSSFVDPQGGSDSTGATNTGVPMVHYISLDHESKAVVLACRGTLGFEDVLADMTCDYDDLVWQGCTYKVHKGIHASARRLLYGGDGRVLLTLRQALEEFEDYGIVLTGHSLGGAVTALLGVMLSEPASTGTSFVTSGTESHRLLPSSQADSPDQPTPPSPPIITLPPGRPIHVYAYGPPATMSSSLRRATRGLITSVVHCNDLVPYLSLGVLHDLQAVALAFKTDNADAKTEVRQRIWEAFQTGLANKWYAQPSADDDRRFMPRDGDDDGEEWAWAALKVLRASMMSRKLVPPGEVFAVESAAVLRRDAFVALEGGGEQLGGPARRVVLKYVRDVEARFREVRFGTGMLTDHSPGKYEDALMRLRVGIMDGG